MTTESTALATTSKPSLVTKFAGRFGIEPDKLLATLKATAFRQRANGVAITHEQMAALLIVADQYGLNPFTKEIFAFEDKGAIVPVVSVDGWARIINSHPEMDGIEFRYAEDTETMPGAKPCPTWCEAIITRKDRAKPIVVREYLDEVYQNRRGNPPKDGPWQTHTKRFLRHKTLIQCARIAFGFAGIYDEDEAQRIIEGEARHIPNVTRPDLHDLQAQLAERSASHTETTEPPIDDGDFTETTPASDD